jgi:hypothetical protein
LADVRASGAYRHGRAARARRQPGWIATLALLLVEACLAIVLVVAGIGMFARMLVAWQTPVDLRAAIPLVDQQLRERPEPPQVYVRPPVEQLVPVRDLAPPPSIGRDGETDVRPIAPAPAAAPERAVDSEAEPRSQEPPASVAAEREPGADAAAPADTGSVAASRSAEDRSKSEDPPAATATTVEPAAAAAVIAPAAVEPAEAAAVVRTEPLPAVETGRDASALSGDPPKPEAVAPAESRVVSEIGRPDTSPPVPAPGAEAPPAGAAETRRAEPVTATVTAAAEPGVPVAADARAAERPAAQAEKPDTTGSIDRVPAAASSNAGDAAAAKRNPSAAGASGKLGEPDRPRTVTRSRPHLRAARRARPRRPPALAAQPATTQTTYGFYPSARSSAPDKWSGEQARVAPR